MQQCLLLWRLRKHGTPDENLIMSSLVMFIIVCLLHLKAFILGLHPLRKRIKSYTFCNTVKLSVADSIEMADCFIFSSVSQLTWRWQGSCFFLLHLYLTVRDRKPGQIERGMTCRGPVANTQMVNVLTTTHSCFSFSQVLILTGCNRDWL